MKKKPWLQHISAKTKELIEAKHEAAKEGRREEAQKLRKAVKKSAREDKRKWMSRLIDSDMKSKDAWQGLEIIGTTYKPKRDARKDRHGQY